MQTHELSALIDQIRFHATTWLGGEACENLERLIKYTCLLHERAERHDALIRKGYRMTQVEHDGTK